MFDTHCHLHSSEFDNDREAIIKNLRSKDIHLVTVGTNCEDSDQAIYLAEENPEIIWATMGVHPHEATEVSFCPQNIRQFSQRARHSKVVAIGEAGFDFHYNSKEEVYQAQEDIFRCQIEIALDLKKPLIIHTRDSFEETYNLLAEYQGQELTVIYHCFTGSPEWVSKLSSLDNISYFSFSGIVTFRNKVEEIQASAKGVPIDRLLIETDSPYLAPVPYRGLRNEPTFLSTILEKISELRNIPCEELERQLDMNSRTVFQL